ncbi:MAG TPA: hypothetical protein VFZ48_04040 [Candidatus Saccharimonadales bacterium]
MQPTATKDNDQQDELNPGQRHADAEFNNVTKGYNPPSWDEESAVERARQSEKAAANGASDTNDQNAAQSERSAAESTNSSLAGRAKNAAVSQALNSAGAAGRALNYVRNHKRGSAIGGSIGVIICIILFAFITLAPAGMFLHLKEMGTRWMLKYQEIGVGRRASKLLKQSYFGDSKQCTDNKWKCRHNQGITDKELKKLERAGFAVTTEERGNPKKKYVSKMEYDDPISGKRETINANNFVDAFKSRPGFRSTFGKVMTPKAYNLRSKSVVGKLVGKLGINRRGFAGDEKEREGIIKKMRNYLYARSNSDSTKANIDESEYNKEGKPALNVEQLEGIAADLAAEAAALNKEAIEKGVPPSSIPSAEGLLNGDTDTLTKIGSTVAEGAKGGAKGAVMGALAGVDAYCSIYQLIRTLSLMMKVYAGIQLLQYTHMYLTAADQLKDSKITAAFAAYIGSILLRASVKPESKGKTVSDSLAVSLLSGGKVSDNEAIQRFTVGGGFKRVLDRVASILNTGNISPTICGKLNSPVGQIGLAVGGIISSILTGGFTGVAFGAAVGAAKGIVMGMVGQFAMPLIVQMAAGVVAPDPENDPEGGFGAGNAFVAGLVTLGAEVGKSSAQKPLTKAEVAYIDKVTVEERRTIAAVEELESKQKGLFSWDNPMSFTNRMAMAMAPFMSALTQNQNLATIMSGGTQIIGAGFTALPGLMGSAYAQEKVDYYRGDLCKDDANEKWNLASTAVCGNIYGPTAASLSTDPKWNPDAVDDWMIRNKHVNGESGQLSDELTEFKEICMDSVDIPITEDGKGVEASDEGFGICLSNDEKYTYFREFLGYENDDQSRKDAAEDKLGIGTTAGAGGAGPVNISGDAKSLAQQILDSSKISFRDNPDGKEARAAFEATARGEQANVPYKGTKTNMSTALMRAMLQASQTYSFVIGYSTNGKHGESSYHYKGSSVDINGINGQGPPLNPAGAHREISRQFAEHIAKFLPAGSGIGEKQCMGQISLPPGFRYFDDSCDHLHIDAGDAP